MDLEVVHERVAALDISKSDVKVAVRTPGKRRGHRHTEKRVFTTMTGDLLALRDWLEQVGVTRIAMEATGDYWKAPYYVLTSLCEVILANAAAVKAMPGRKTDMADAVWLAVLLERGMVRSSFVPPEDIQQLRDLTRYRSALVAEATREKNRAEKELEGAGIKLSVVISDIFGVSGRLMLRALIDGERDPKTLAEFAQGRMRSKIATLERAMLGRFGEHHAFLVRLHLRRVEAIEADIAALEARIEEMVAPFRDAIKLLITIPGVSCDVAHVIIAETGGDMSVFATPQQLCSWGGVAPGNHQSGPRRKKAAATHGDSWLRAALGIAALAASRTNNTYLGATYRRYCRRMPKLKALVALQHSILDAVWHMLTDKVPYRDLGADYHARRNPHKTITQALRMLNAAGFTATITPIPQPTPTA